MNKELKDLCERLSADIQSSYEEGVTMPEAEKLAGKFLYAQIQVANEIAEADLDARMKRAGVKAIKAAVYLEHARATDKKPSDTMLGALVDSDKIVASAVEDEAAAEIYRDWLKNQMAIFSEAHVHFRTIAKGSFS